MKYVKSYAIRSMTNEIANKICRGNQRGMHIVWYLHTEKCAKGVTKEYREEIFKEFEGIEDGFFWTDEHRITNMITDEKFVKELRQLLNDNMFNWYSFGGELHIYFS
jgi:hypothetical protein